MLVNFGIREESVFLAWMVVDYAVTSQLPVISANDRRGTEDARHMSVDSSCFLRSPGTSCLDFESQSNAYALIWSQNPRVFLTDCTVVCRQRIVGENVILCACKTFARQLLRLWQSAFRVYLYTQWTVKRGGSTFVIITLENLPGF